MDSNTEKQSCYAHQVDTGRSCAGAGYPGTQVPPGTRVPGYVLRRLRTVHVYPGTPLGIARRNSYPVFTNPAKIMIIEEFLCARTLSESPINRVLGEFRSPTRVPRERIPPVVPVLVPGSFQSVVHRVPGYPIPGYPGTLTYVPGGTRVPGYPGTMNFPSSYPTRYPGTR
eukprot:1188447-Rhodomonas_salina.3